MDESGIAAKTLDTGKHGFGAVPGPSCGIKEKLLDMFRR